MQVSRRKKKKKIEKERESSQTDPSSFAASSPSRPTTPDRLPITPDPNYSGSSTNSQDEEPTKQLAGNFLSSTMLILSENFCQLKFQKKTKGSSSSKVQLSIPFVDPQS
jgi:hypothetical protein